jgi:hypothetical protein
MVAEIEAFATEDGGHYRNHDLTVQRFSIDHGTLRILLQGPL